MIESLARQIPGHDKESKMQIELSPTFLASCAIVRAARNNPAITVAGLQDELERGAIDGWLDIVRRWNLNFSQWSGAMERAIAVLSA